MLATTLCGCDRGDAPALATTRPGGPEAATPAWFTDSTPALGLSFTHDPGAPGRFFMPETVGSGAALFDADNDGRLDVYLLQNAGPGSSSTNRFFRQTPDGHFRDATQGSGLGVAGFGMGVAAGDVNNDGWTDLFVTEYRNSRLFLNRGDGTFADVAREAGVASQQWGTSAAFFDYDRDGWLDLVVVNYIDYSEAQRCTDQAGRPEYCGPNAFPGTVARLYHNVTGRAAGAVGERPTPAFEDVTLAAGMAMPGPGLGVVCADFTGDQWPDILVANDAKPNRLWVNQKDGTFKDEALLRGIAYNTMGQAQANMGIAVGDVDGNGLVDAYVTHLTEETNVLWAQQPPGGAFIDRTAAAGLVDARWRGTGFGTVLADFNHDGLPDLAVANGRVRRAMLPADKAAGAPAGAPGLSLPAHWVQYAERNQLFVNAGGGAFRDASPSNPALCGTANVARGLACGDVNNDGAMDLLVTAIAAPARLLTNTAPARGHWLLVRATDPHLGGRDAYGARVVVTAGGKRHVGWVNPGYSYACSNDPRAHFGLGDAAGVDSIEVSWPDGSDESFPGGAADRIIELRKGASRAGPSTKPG